jgi:transcriptional regulator of acetoin/glycerol metabolism
MNADQIREELQGLAQVRAGLEADLAKLHADSAAALRKASESEDLTMSEAAELLGLSRQRTYKLMREH